MKRTALVGLEVGAFATASWLIPASVYLSAWPASGPVRIAYLAPLSRLYAVIGAAALLMTALAAIWKRSGRTVDGLARALSPVLLLWLWLVPYLPWLADRAPLLLLLAGPLRWVVAGLALAGVASAGWPPVPRGLVSALTPRRRTVFIVSFAVYALFGLRSARDIGFGGDEPHYLIIAESLIKDHDLDIANNHERRDYRSFFPGELRPDFLRRGVHGEIYSIHAPGLPVLLTPAYAAFGARGAVVFLALLAALTALAIFDLATQLAGGPAATVTWVATCFTVPFVPHAWLIYPELPGALVVAWAALWLHEPPVEPRTQLLHGATLAVLPWLHTKFVVLVAAFAFFELARSWRNPRAVAALLAPIAVSSLAWLWSFNWMYGEFNPEAPYGTYTRMFVLAANIPRGALGLLFDQKFGLLAFSPVYLLGIGGLWVLLRRSQERIYAVELTLTAAAFCVSTTRLYMWWGGSSAPARFLVPSVPLVAPLVAVAIAEARGVLARSAVAATLALTLALAAIPLGVPSLLYSDPHGVSSLVKAVQGSAPLDVSLPTFTEENWRAPVGTLVPWIVSFALAAAGLWVCVRRRWLKSVFWTASAGGLGILVLGALMFGLGAVPNRSAAVLRGQLALLRDFDPPHLRAVDVSHVRRFGEQEILEAATLVIRRTPDAEIQNPRVLEGPMELPEGQYVARVWFSGDAPPAAEAFAALSDQIVLARAVAPLTNPVVLTFDLPVRTPAFVGVSDAGAARAVSRIDIAASRILPRSTRDREASHVVEPVGGDVPGFMVYADDHTYPENGVYWTRATEEGSVTVVTGGAATLRLVLHTGPTGGRVTVTVAGRAMDVDFQPDETRELAFPVPPGTKRVAVAVRAARAFRPADVDPRSDDRRLLGCQVRPLLF